jgi:hypothetical protein
VSTLRLMIKHEAVCVEAFARARTHTHCALGEAYVSNKRASVCLHTVTLGLCARHFMSQTYQTAVCQQSLGVIVPHVVSRIRHKHCTCCTYLHLRICIQECIHTIHSYTQALLIRHLARCITHCCCLSSPLQLCCSLNKSLER